MTAPHSRLDAHNNGDCDASSCPLCAIEIEEERAARDSEDMADHVVWYSEPCDCEAGDDHDAGQEVRP